MRIRLIAIIFLLFFSIVEVDKFLKNKKEDLNKEKIKEQLELKTGDIIVRKEDNALSDFLSSIDSSTYSHIALVLNTNDIPSIFHFEFSDDGEDLKISSVKEFVNFSKKIAVYRHKEAIDEDKFFKILSEIKNKKIKFDFNFELDNEAFYCTEFVNEVYFKLFNENLYTYLFKYYDKEGISIKSILQNKNLKKRFELSF